MVNCEIRNTIYEIRIKAADYTDFLATKRHEVVNCDIRHTIYEIRIKATDFTDFLATKRHKRRKEILATN